MSHEIRTPLNAILGMFQLISTAKELGEKQRKQAMMGIEAARRLHRNLSNVLDTSRLDAGALRVQVETADLRGLTQTWQVSLEAYVTRAERPIACSVEISEALPTTARVDAAALTQVVNNLQDNAVKFTEAGTVSVTVTSRGSTLCIVVADTGLGIDPRQRATIFERFYQVEEGIERRFSGTGLGLSISRDLIRLMNGDITIRDNTPHGTIFEVTIPDALTEVIPMSSVVGSESDLATRAQE